MEQFFTKIEDQKIMAHTGVSLQEGDEFRWKHYLVETVDGMFISKQLMTLPQVKALLPNCGLVFVSDEPIRVELEEKAVEVEETKPPVRRKKKAVKKPDNEA